MNPADKKLLLRVAQRMERAARDKFAAAPADRTDEAKRTRDTELGDVLDLRDFVDRVEKAHMPLEPTPKMCAAGAVVVVALPPNGDQQAVDPSQVARDVYVAMTKVLFL